MKKAIKTVFALILSLAMILVPVLSCSAASTETYYRIKKLTEFKEEHGLSNSYDVTMDDMTRELCDAINEVSDFDIELFVTNLPKLQPLARFFCETLGINNIELHQKLRDTAYSLYQVGEQNTAVMYHVLSLIVGVMNGFDISLVNRYDSVYEFILHIYYADGFEEDVGTGVFYDPEAGTVKGADGTGIGGIGFNFDVNNMVVYATNDCWMRSTGFCVEYDLAANGMGLFDYDTRRFYFDYDGREWLIQMWKGNYILANGAEVGIYNRDESKVGTFYDVVSDEERLNTSLELYHGDDLLFSLEEQPTWWANGFQLNKNLYDASELTLKWKMTFTNEEMLNAFISGLNNEKHQDFTYSVEDLSISLTW